MCTLWRRTLVTNDDDDDNHDHDLCNYDDDKEFDYFRRSEVGVDHITSSFEARLPFSLCPL